jgi:hypothetical protein
MPLDAAAAPTPTPRAQRALPLLFLAFLIPPAAVYLLFLGWLNRRPRPVFVAGPWDFFGVLCALSGLLLFGGPALISSLDEKARMFWLLGETNYGLSAEEIVWAGWLVRAVYFLAVAGAAALLLWRSRRLTSVYNVDPDALQPALLKVFQRLGLTPTRVGEQYQLTPAAASAPDPAPAGRAGVSPAFSPGRAGGTPALPAAAVVAAPDVPDPAADDVPALAVVVGGPARPAALRVDVFRLLRHATLKWSPADFPLRKEVEHELARMLGEAPLSEVENMQGGCLTVLGTTLLALTLLAGLVVVLLRWLPPPK